MIVTPAMADALRLRKPRVLLIDVDHPDGHSYFWTGFGSLSYDGKTWLGAGGTLGLRVNKRETKPVIDNTVFELRGVPGDKAVALSEAVRLRPALAYLACQDDYGAIIADPLLIVDAVMDFQAVRVGDDGKATIAITTQPHFWTLERAVNVSWSNEEQKNTYPTDTGFSLIAPLETKEVVWTLT